MTLVSDVRLMQSSQDLLGCHEAVPQDPDVRSIYNTFPPENDTHMQVYIAMHVTTLTLGRTSRMNPTITTH